MSRAALAKIKILKLSSSIIKTSQEKKKCVCYLVDLLLHSLCAQFEFKIRNMFLTWHKSQVKPFVAT